VANGGVLSLTLGVHLQQRSSSSFAGLNNVQRNVQQLN
jgi:hypothetical protein